LTPLLFSVAGSIVAPVGCGFLAGGLQRGDGRQRKARTGKKEAGKKSPTLYFERETIF
jgi:hypothetical protein